jgi:hypothetical protein
MPETDDKSPRSTTGYLGIAAATIFGLVAVEEGLTKFISGVPALWTALQNVAPAQRSSPPAKPESSPEHKLSPQGTFGLADYLGDWRNSDPNTRGITRVSLNNEGSTLQLQAWGKCHPTDCDWGKTDATAFARNVGSRPGTDILSVEALFKTGFSETKVVMELQEKSTMKVDTSDHFTDNSGRSDYRSTETLAR